MGLFDHFPYTNVHELNLDWVLANLKDIIDEIASLDNWKAQHEEEYEQLKELYDEITSGDFPDSMINALNEWMRANALDLVGSLVDMVFFGINDNGYFVAYIPESWNDIAFNTTGLDINIPDYDYGRLVLSINLDGQEDDGV